MINFTPLPLVTQRVNLVSFVNVCPEEDSDLQASSHQVHIPTFCAMDEDVVRARTDKSQ